MVTLTRRYAKCLRAPSPGMNGLESRFSGYLKGLEIVGDLSDVKFQSITLKLGDDCRYTPDFSAVSAKDDALEFYETKGFMRDDAQVKLKAAATQFRFLRFYLVREVKKRGASSWDIQLIEPA